MVLADPTSLVLARDAKLCMKRVLFLEPGYLYFIGPFIETCTNKITVSRFLQKLHSTGATLSPSLFLIQPIFNLPFLTAFLSYSFFLSFFFLRQHLTLLFRLALNSS